MSEAWRLAWELIAENGYALRAVVGTTMRMSGISSAASLALGVPLGLAIASNEFPGKKIAVIALRTLMGLPPVVVGIVLFVLFSGTGPFGRLRLMYSVPLMIIAQIALIVPIVAGMTESAVTPAIVRMRPTLKGLGAGALKRFLLTLNEGKYQFVAIYMFAFARSISEVGAAQIVGGNILYKTRVMTTAIALNYNTGDFSLALALAVILLAVALAFNLLAGLLQRASDGRYAEL